MSLSRGRRRFVVLCRRKNTHLKQFILPCASTLQRYDRSACIIHPDSSAAQPEYELWIFYSTPCPRLIHASLCLHAYVHRRSDPHTCTHVCVMSRTFSTPPPKHSRRRGASVARSARLTRRNTHLFRCTRGGTQPRREKVKAKDSRAKTTKRRTSRGGHEAAQTHEMTGRKASIHACIPYLHMYTQNQILYRRTNTSTS